MDKLRKGLQEEADKAGAEMRVLGAYARDATGKEWRGPVNMKHLAASSRR
jgi:hypothetical protein